MGVATRGGSQAAHDRRARPGHDGHGDLGHQLGPAAPAVQVLQAVGAHDPDEGDAGIAGLQGADGVDGVAHAQPGFRIGHDHARPPRHGAGRGHPPRQLRRRARLQGIAWRDQPDHPVQPQPLQRRLGHMRMALVRRIEGAAEQPDPHAGLQAQAHVQGAVPDAAEGLRRRSRRPHGQPWTFCGAGPRRAWASPAPRGAAAWRSSSGSV